MNETGMKIFLQAGAVGVLAGMRSISAPAVVTDYLAKRPDTVTAGAPLHYLSSPWVGRSLRALAAGEMVADKLPIVPERTSPPSAMARTLSGGLAGALLGMMYQHNALLTGLVGAAAATGTTYGMYRLRKQASEETAVPDAAWGILEDMLVLGVGYYVRRTLAQEEPIL